MPAASIDFLKRVSMFEDLDQKSLEAIANAAVEQRYEPGQDIVRQGDTGVGAFIIRSGKVDVIQDRGGKETKLSTLGPGEVFGEMALLDESPRSADARAHASCRLLVITKDAFDDLLFLHKDLAYEVLWACVRMLSGRLCLGQTGRRQFTMDCPKTNSGFTLSAEITLRSWDGSRQRNERTGRSKLPSASGCPSRSPPKLIGSIDGISNALSNRC